MKYLSSVSTVAAVAAVLGLVTTTVHGFSITSPRKVAPIGTVGSGSKSPLFVNRAVNSATTLMATGDAAAADTSQKKKKSLKELRAEGGPFTINTPIGALNPFAVYYFFVSVALGIPWICLVRCWQLVHWISRGRFDPRVSVRKDAVLDFLII